MAATELEKTLKRMKVTIKTVEQPGTPSRGYLPNARPWRVILSRENKDNPERPLRLTFTLLSPTEPDLSMALQCLAGDVENSEMTLWEFAQEFNRGKTDKGTERMLKCCKQTAGRGSIFYHRSSLIVYRIYSPWGGQAAGESANVPRSRTIRGIVG
jgi:hypothetical protein